VDNPTDIETDLIDLADCMVDEIRGMPPERLAPYTEKALRQVERPRLNLGGTGPPGRAD
jgi:hypothetical protein